MSLDARSITIGLSVVLLVAIGWMLVGNSEEEPPTTTAVAVGTTATSTTSMAMTTTTESTTTTVAPTTTSTTTTLAPTTSAPTTTVAPSTSGPTRSTVTIPPPLEEPDLTMCRENEIPDRHCRWVGVEYPKITAGPEEDPLEFLRQYADFLDWSNANPIAGHTFKDLATTGSLLDELRDRGRGQLEAGNVGLPRTSIEEPVETIGGGDRMTLEATVVRSHVYTVGPQGAIVVDREPPAPARWRFEAVRTEQGWRISDMESIE